MDFDERWTNKVFPFLNPNTLKRMTLFEDSTEAHDPCNKLYIWGLIALFFTNYQIGDPEPAWVSNYQNIRKPRTVSAQLARALAEASLGLEHLSISFMTDARIFWTSLREDWVWEQLQTLALTSQDLQPDVDSSKIKDVLCSAARAAKKMPKLQTMEIWNGGKGYAALFRYSIERGRRQAGISWKANWHFELEGLVVKEWQDVADANDVGYLKTESELLMLTPSQIRSHGEAILILELKIEVACPVSIQQMHREHTEMEHLLSS
ncbi:unnamed protein product [Periconia digitata]|uniref:DUF6546 domain-containing protein n=1 Tax=Periconia digitata TaxID=1303443 RepID=A0A9W4XPY8_9PLEO|nr:unnamed protein product [Periconia digitata]